MPVRLTSGPSSKDDWDLPLFNGSITSSFSSIDLIAWLQLESELLLEGNEDRRTGRGWEGEITRPRLVVGCGFDVGCFQLDVVEA